MALPRKLFDQDLAVCQVCESITVDSVIIDYEVGSKPIYGRDLVLACRSCWEDHLDEHYVPGDDPEDYL